MAFTITAAVKASLAFTASTIANAETITVGGKQYTFLATVGTTDGNVHIGASDDETINNLVAAIMNDITLGETGVAGTDYAVATVINPECTAARTAEDVMTVTAKNGGTVGNFISVAESAGGAWAGAATVLAGGTGSLAVCLQDVQTELIAIRASTDPPSAELHRIHTLEAQIETVD